MLLTAKGERIQPLLKGETTPEAEKSGFRVGQVLLMSAALYIGLQMAFESSTYRPISVGLSVSLI